VRGTRTRIEQITDLLRDHVWGGDRIVTFVRDTFYKDAFVEQARTAAGGQSSAPQAGPQTARLAPNPASIQPTHLGIDLTQHGVDGRALVASALAAGRWYPVTGSAGVYVSAVQPKMIEPALLQGDRGVVSAMDSVEADAVDYLVGFDLSHFDLGFALGTDHPRVDWSDRAPDSQRAESAGPDGIGTTAPLATTGMVNPALLPRVAATSPAVSSVSTAPFATARCLSGIAAATTVSLSTARSSARCSQACRRFMCLTMARST